MLLNPTLDVFEGLHGVYVLKSNTSSSLSFQWKAGSHIVHILLNDEIVDFIWFKSEPTLEQVKVACYEY